MGAGVAASIRSSLTALTVYSLVVASTASAEAVPLSLTRNAIAYTSVQEKAAVSSEPVLLSDLFPATFCIGGQGAS